MSRRFTYWKLGAIEPTEVSEAEVLRVYWPFYQQQQKKRGIDDRYITDKACVDHWVAMYNAKELADGRR